MIVNKNLILKGEKRLAKNTKKKKVKRLLYILIILIIGFILVINIKEQMMKSMYKKEYSEYVEKYSKEYDVDADLIYAIIKAESNFESKAVSNQNAQGLMQLMYSTAEEIAESLDLELTEENIFEPEINIQLGTKYISKLLEKYECTEVALAAYNAGSGNVDKWIKNGTIKSDGSDIENIPYKETNAYVRKIMRDYEIYKELET